MRRARESGGAAGDVARTAPEVLVAVLDVEVDLVRHARALRGLDALRAEEGGDGNEQETEGEASEYHVGRVEWMEVGRSSRVGRASGRYVSDGQSLIMPLPLLASLRDLRAHIRAVGQQWVLLLVVDLRNTHER